MKIAEFGFLALVAGLLLSGCVVPSLHPFYTEATKIPLEDLNGEWQLIREFGEDVQSEQRQHWSIADNVLTTYDSDGKQGKLTLIPFKLKGQIFVDCYAESPDEISFYWSCHVFPVHTVCRLEQDGDMIRAVPLNADWFEGMVKKGSIKAATTDEGYSILTMAPRHLQKFLMKYLNDPGAFSANNEIVLRRVH